MVRLKADSAGNLLASMIGLRVLGVGRLLKDSGAFERNRPRTLRSFAAVYIDGGSGVFQSAPTGRRDVLAGELFFLFPGVWHRYGPRRGGRWREYWMIFDGFIAENYRRTGLLDPALPFFSLGADRALVRRWRECLYLARSSRRGRSQMLSQALFALLGHVFAEGRRTAAGDSGDSPRDAVARVIEVMESRLEAPAFDLAAAAAALHVGHSTLRRRFREATGLSAARYFAEMKMQAARARLLNTDAPVKVIAAALGFADPYHFSRRFKQLAGVSPQHFRRGFRGESPAPASE